MLLSNPSVTRWLRTHHGVISRAKLIEFGASEQRIQRWMASGQLVAMRRGVYRLPVVDDGRIERIAAVCGANPAALLSHQSAAELWNLRGVPRVRSVHITVPTAQTPELPGVTVHRSNLITGADRATVEGLPVTGPLRTAFDLATVLTPARLESVIEQMLDRELCTFTGLQHTERRLATKGRNGARRFSEVLASRPAWIEPVDSELEIRLERALHERGLRRFVRQHPVHLPGIGTVHIDLADPAVLLALEVDHSFWHDRKLSAVNDKQRDRKLTMLNWTSMRVTDHDIETRLDETVDEIVAVYRRLRGSRPA